MDKYYALVKNDEIFYTLKVKNADLIKDYALSDAINDIFVEITRKQRDLRKYYIIQITEERYDNWKGSKFYTFRDKNHKEVEFTARVGYKEKIHPVMAFLKRQLFCMGFAFTIFMQIANTYSAFAFGNVVPLGLSTIYIIHCLYYVHLISNTEVAVEGSDDYRKFVDMHGRLATLAPLCMFYNIKIFCQVDENKWDWVRDFYTFMASTEEYIEKVK